MTWIVNPTSFLRVLPFLAPFTWSMGSSHECAMCPTPMPSNSGHVIQVREMIPFSRELGIGARRVYPTAFLKRETTFYHVG